MVVHGGFRSLKNVETGERFCEGNVVTIREGSPVIISPPLKVWAAGRTWVVPCLEISFQWKEEQSLALAIWMTRDLITLLRTAGVKFKTYNNFWNFPLNIVNCALEWVAGPAKVKPQTRGQLRGTAPTAASSEGRRRSRRRLCGVHAVPRTAAGTAGRRRPRGPK